MEISSVFQLMRLRKPSEIVFASEDVFKPKLNFSDGPGRVG